jgi:hypothetical protein
MLPGPGPGSLHVRGQPSAGMLEMPLHRPDLRVLRIGAGCKICLLPAGPFLIRRELICKRLAENLR